MPELALCVFATGRYLEFVPALAASVRAYFKPCRVTMVILTDGRLATDAATCFVPHLPWPLGTMLRYGFLAHRPFLREFDYVFMCDADALFVAPVGPEVLGDRVAVLGHHHTQHQPAAYPYCRDETSAAYVAPAEGTYYYIGGFQGGSTKTYLGDCANLSNMVASDLRRRVIPLWHDESYWNRYLIDHPPTVTLPWPFCAGDDDRTEATRLLAIRKDHSAYRE